MTTKSITEPIIQELGYPPGGNLYVNQGITYDIAIGGMPFFLGASDKYPYKRETAQYRRQQIDQTKEPGEQTLTGWWLRSQSSFHYGCGIKFEEPIQGETVPYRFNKSAGVDVFNIGRVSLLPDTELVYTSANTPIMVAGVDANGVDVLIVADGSALKRVTSSGTTTLTWGGSGTIHAITQDGLNYYAANSTGIYKGPLTGASSGASVFTYPTSVGTVTSVKLGWVKQRIIAGVNNYLFEVTPITSYGVTAGQISANTVKLKTDTTPHNFSVGSQVTVSGVGASFDGTWLVTNVPDSTTFEYFNSTADHVWTTGYTGAAVLASNNSTPIYAHPNTTWKWTGIAEGPNAIYASGYCGTSSSIVRLLIDTTGNVPLINKAVTAADLPNGEYATGIATYIGKFIVMGTSKGIRVGQIDTSGYYSSGYITYGPLSVITNGYDPVSSTNLTGSPVTGITFQDRFAYCTVSNFIDNGDGTFSSGLVKIDLSREIAQNQMAYATHLRAPSTNIAGDVVTWGNTNKLCFAVAGKGIYAQSTNLCSSGYIQTGLIRYLTMEDKYFKLIKVRLAKPVVSNVKISKVDSDGAVTDILTMDPSYDQMLDIGTKADNALESLAFRFTIFPSSTDQTAATVFNGYQLKGLPAVHRKRLITIPILNFDFEGDRYNEIVGYEGRASERLFDLEEIEANGDVISLQDFTSGETVQGIIETIEFSRITPPERRFKGFGGVIYLQFRTI